MDATALAKDLTGKYEAQGFIFSPMDIDASNDGLLVAFTGENKPAQLPAEIQRYVDADPAAEWEQDEEDQVWLMSIKVT